LACYDVLERPEWDRPPGRGFLPADQVQEIRRLSYETLLWLAADLADRHKDHRSGQDLARGEAARAALRYLDQGAAAYPATFALYWLRGRCRDLLGQAE